MLSTDFAIWLCTQDIITQLIVYSIMIISIAMCLIIDKRVDEINEKIEFKKFVLDYYNRNIKLQRWTVLVHLYIYINNP